MLGGVMWFFYAKKNVFAYYARFKVYEVGILNTKKRNVIIQYLHNYDAKIHLKSLSAMGFLLTVSFSYGLSSKCFDLPE